MRPQHQRRSDSPPSPGILPVPSASAVLFCCLLLTQFPTSGSSAQSVDQIIDRHIEAIGGRVAIEAIQSIRYERVYAHLEEEALYHHVISKKRPDRSRNERLGGDYCVIVNGTRRWTRVIDTSGDTAAWEEDAYLRGVSNNFEERIGPFIDHRKKGIGLEYIGTELIDDITLDHLEMTWPDGRLWHLYFDTGTGLWSMFRSNERSLSKIHDYRRIGDILFPHLVETTGTLPDGTPAHHLNTITSVELNIPLDDSLFHPDPAPLPIPSEAATAGEIIALVTDGLEGLRTGDPGRITGRCADDVTYFSVEFDSLLVGRTALEEMYGPATSQIYYDHFDLINPVVQIFKDTAVIAFDFASYTTTDDSQLRVRWRSTQILHRTASGWKYVHIHWTLLENNLQQRPDFELVSITDGESGIEGTNPERSML
ncbi:YybH family protein [Candidatus Zixiibacteriota bacterium]